MRKKFKKISPTNRISLLFNFDQQLELNTKISPYGIALYIFDKYTLKIIDKNRRFTNLFES